MKPKASIQWVEFYRLHDVLGSRSSASKEMQVTQLFEQVRDMLRYDTAFIPMASQGLEDAIVAFPCIKYLKCGSGGGKPTLARWESFGLRLEPADDLALTLRPTIPQWITYRHPRLPHGPVDYGRLEPVALAAILAGEDV